MGRVTGIGGVFFKCDNPKAMLAWYRDHLGIPTDGQYGAIFQWRSIKPTHEKGYTVWGTFKKDTHYFEPSGKPFMLNYRVENLPELLETLHSEGVTVVGDMEEYSYGRFGWVMDPEGHKIELWQPFDEAFARENRLEPGR